MAPAANSDADAPLTDEAASTGDLPRQLPFCVVALGASAGGLEAFTEVLRALPADTGMAFVVLPHLSPTHDSMMAEILGRVAAMPVTEVHDEPEVQPDRVYVIPPDRNMVIEHGKLRLSPRRAGGGPRRTIDQFLYSLAREQADNAIAVILSGTGDDGAAGVRDVKLHGGITFAQDGAQQDGMPQSAVATGCVDFVLPPVEIAQELVRISQHPYVRPGAAEPTSAQFDANAVAQVLDALYHQTGVDFTHYKRNTLYRRISRRLVLHRLDSLQRYTDLLRTNPAEAEALYHDVLISVTSFFRDAGALQALRDTVFPRLLERRARHDSIRVWVVGCSTGEEAYSLAIALTEYTQALPRSVPIQIFATDLSARSIAMARAGIYPLSIAEQVAPDRLRQFFTEVDGSYRIAKAIRDLCIFAQHNGLTDPPFSRIDLISCRNLLIYFDRSLQQRMVPILHRSLKPGGFLWLGSSETLGEYRDLFDVADPRHKIYARRGGNARSYPLTPPDPRLAGARPLHRPTDDREDSGAVNWHREADRILLNRYTPPSVLVNHDFEILQFRGDTGPFLTPMAGKASLNLFKMLQEGLLVGVRGALTRARKDATPVIRETGLKVRSHGGYRRVDIEVLAVQGPHGEDGCFLVIFEDPDSERPAPRTDITAASPDTADQDGSEVARLRHDLAATKEYLQSVFEQQEAANEELQSANEEVQSTNEELQSINEELETSKEEIQSSNEELATVNDELHHSNDELTRSNNDLLNLLSSVQMAIVMLGPDLRIRRFTPAAERLLNLIATDVGRPMSDIKLTLTVPDLDARLAEVISASTPYECEGRDRRGRWYSLRLAPYRTVDNRIDGAVLVLVDIDAIKQQEQAVRESEARFRLLADSAPVLIWLADPQGIQFVNRAFLEFAGAEQPEMSGARWEQLIHPEDRSAYLSAYAAATASGARFEAQCRMRRADGEYRWMKTIAQPREDGSDHGPGYVGSTVDVDDLKTAETSLRDADRNKNDFLAMLAHELRNPLAPIHNVVHLLKSPERDDAMVDWARDVLERQTRALSRMVDDLLDVSRITRGRIQLRTEIVDVRTVLNRSMELLAHTLRQRNQQLDIQGPGVPVLVDADPLRLQQVFGNLLHNATKFTPADGHILVRIDDTAAPGPDGPAEVEIRVQDDGVGIAPELLPQIFEPFIQGDRSMGRANGGLGIGLALVRSLIELHHGRVSASSDGPGSGSEFVIRLPIAQVDQHHHPGQPARGSDLDLPTPG